MKSGLRSIAFGNMLCVLGAACALLAQDSLASRTASPDDLSRVTDENSGARKYALHCGGCHGLDGRGDADADVPSFLPHVGTFLHDPDGRQYLVNVGGIMAADVSDAETAEILNYMILQFGHSSLPADAIPFDAEQVARLRADPIDAVAVRRNIAARLKEKQLQLPEDYPWP